MIVGRGKKLCSVNRTQYCCLLSSFRKCKRHKSSSSRRKSSRINTKVIHQCDSFRGKTVYLSGRQTISLTIMPGWQLETSFWRTSINCKLSTHSFYLVPVLTRQIAVSTSRKLNIMAARWWSSSAEKRITGLFHPCSGINPRGQKTSGTGWFWRSPGRCFDRLAPKQWL